MAWEVFHRFQRGVVTTLDFDFTEYRYRAISEGATGSFGDIYKNSSYSSINTFVIANIRFEYKELVEGMNESSSGRVGLVNGPNDLYIHSSNAYPIVVIERLLLWSPPNLQAKIGGAIRETEMAWVKVDGQLREVDKVWTRVNGVLREV